MCNYIFDDKSECRQAQTQTVHPQDHHGDVIERHRLRRGGLTRSVLTLVQQGVLLTPRLKQTHLPQLGDTVDKMYVWSIHLYDKQPSNIRTYLYINHMISRQAGKFHLLQDIVHCLILCFIIICCMVRWLCNQYVLRWLTSNWNAVHRGHLALQLLPVHQRPDLVPAVTHHRSVFEPCSPIQGTHWSQRHSQQGPCTTHTLHIVCQCHLQDLWMGWY